MIDIVFPKDNEKKFISVAERLSLEGLCLVYDKPRDISEFQKSTKLKLLSAVLCVPNDVPRYKSKFLTLVSAPDDQTELRHIIESVRPGVLFNLEFAKRKDFLHHRASGLNHVLATIAADKGVAVGFNFSAILSAKPRDRAVCTGRMSQNISFARKFKFRPVIASFASKPFHMRSEKDLLSFFVALGMNSGEAQRAMGWREEV
jgi:hypothetical protein